MVCAQPKFEFKAAGRFDTEWISGRNNPPNNANANSAVPGAPANFGAPALNADPRGFDNTNSWLNSRATLIFDAKMGNEVSGTVIFEMDAIRWGDSPGGAINKISERNNAGFWGADRSSVEVKNMYLDFGVPGVPVPTTMRVGVQPLAIRPTFFLYTDGTGATAGIKVDPLTIAPFWFKALEGREWSADDVDIYGVQLRAAINKITVGGYGVYYNMNSYPFFVTSATPAGYNAVIQGERFRADFLWLGAYSDGKLGPLNFNFDFVYDNGEVEGRGALGALDDVDYNGFAARAKVDFPWEKFNFGAIGAYGSGADAKKTSANGLPGTTVLNTGNPAVTNNITRKVNTAVIPPGSEASVMFGESLIFYSSPVVRYTGWSANLNNFAVTPGALGGSWFAKLYTSYKAAPDFKVTLQGLYIGDTTTHGNTIGTARKAGGRLRSDSDIGFELDLITELQIYKNLTWQAGFGYMFMGDAMDFATTPRPGVVINKTPDDAWTLQSRIMYVF
jgi:hypothetical protein